MANSMLFIAGAAIGAVTIAVNIYLLKPVIRLMSQKKTVFRGYLIHLSRFIIYGITAVACCRLGMIPLIGYVISIVLMPVVMALRIVGKEDADDKL
ncbi:MAG: hypothetical protein ACI4LC_01990 [Emergencia sp.]